MPWPSWPMILRTSTSHEEGCERQWSIVTKEFIGDEQGHLKALKDLGSGSEKGSRQSAKLC
jgi:glutamate synthase (NADPH/NADH) small chain